MTRMLIQFSCVIVSLAIVATASIAFGEVTVRVIPGVPGTETDQLVVTSMGGAAGLFSTLR